MSQQEVINAVAALKASMDVAFAAMNVPISSLRVFANEAAASAAAAHQSAIDASNGGPSPSPAISPNALTLTGAAGSSAAGDLGVVSNATATTVVSVTPAISGMTFSMVGNTLRAAGSYPAAGSYSAAIVIGTDKGNLTFNLTATATAVAPTLSISPASATIAATAEQPVDELLTTVSGGVPSGATGTLPAGLNYTISGQQIRLTGTAAAAAASAARAAVIATSNGNITLNWNLTVNAAVTEAQAYAARVAAVSTPLSAPTIAAIETWVAALKTAGAWAAIKDCGLMIGSDLAAALVKIKYPAGAPSSLANIGMNNSHYQAVGGVGWYGGNENDNQSLDTVSTAAQLGASGTNISMGFMRMDYRDEAKPWFSAAVASGTAEAPAYITDYNSGTPDKVAVTGNGPSLRVVSVTADSKALVLENGAVVQDYSGSNGGTVTALDAAAHFTMFKARRFGVDFFGTLRTGFYFVGTALTKAQAVALSRATRVLYRTLGRLNTKADCAYVGDSITAGFFISNPNNRWSTISAVARNREEVNFGVPSSSIRVINADAQPLINRYLDIIAEDPGEFSVMMGSNDILTDGNANGDPTIIADCKAKMTTVLTAFKNTGKPVRVNGFPFTAQVSLTKASAYEVAIADVCRTLGIPYCSQWLRMTDTGNTASLLGNDGVHPSEPGMAVLAAGDVELAGGKTTRSVTLDFPSVAAGGTQDLSVTMYTAALAGPSDVSVALPAGFPAGLTATATATASNTVRIRVSNSTGAAIDPPAGTFLVTLNFTQPVAGTPALTPSPASAVVATVATPVDVVLSTLSNATLTSVSGTLPAGLQFEKSGQDVKLTGTPTVVSAAANRTATVVTPDGNLSLTVPLTVNAAATSYTAADLRFEGAENSQTITNSASGGGALAFTIPSGNARLKTGVGVKQGTLALSRGASDFLEPGALSATAVTLAGAFFMGGWFVRDGNLAGNGNGAACAIGDYDNGPSYLDIEVSGNDIACYRQAGGTDLIMQGSVASWAPGIPTYVAVMRDALGVMRLTINGAVVATASGVTDTFTGRVGVLNTLAAGYGLQDGWADLFKLVVGDPVYTVFPFTPPTT